MNIELENAFLELENELQIPTPMGMKRGTPQLRYITVLIAIKKKICPHKEELLMKIRSDESEVLATVVDAMLSYVTTLPIVAATISKYICAHGLENFCEDPAELVNVQLPKDE